MKFRVSFFYGNGGKWIHTDHLYHKRYMLMKRSNMKTEKCDHVKEIRSVKPSGSGCKECLEMGDSWVHLRFCLSCGHIGCCDSSKNKHATKHFHQTRHPIIQSFQPGEDWRWCFVHEMILH